VAPLGKQLDRLFAELVAVTGRAGRTFTIVSSLADGADRIVSQAGLTAGFTLTAVLPLEQQEYQKDFEADSSQAEFQRLLSRASTIHSLDGNPEQRPLAYEAAGLFMLANIEALIAIWDGKPAAGVGGTEEIVSRARAGGLSVIWVEPTDPQAIQICQPPKGQFQPGDIATAVRVLKGIIAPQLQ
jgi:hypothetical protein